MNKQNLLLWHVGLGDALICNGLVRELHSRLGQLTLPVLPKYQKSIEWMFGDLPHVNVLPLNGFDEVMDDLALKRRHLEALVSLKNYNEMAIGLLNATSPIWQGRRTIDEGFYDQAGVPFEFKWSKFSCRRHPDQIIPPSEPYVFVHMDAARKYTFEPRFVGQGYRVVTNLEWGADNLFQWQDVLEQAAEVHVMESVFSNWIELMPHFRERPMYLYDAKHMYGGPGFPVYKNRRWEIVTWCPTRGLRLNVRGGGNAASLMTLPNESGTILVTIQRAGTTVLWDIQLRKPGLPVEQGTAYELAFRARAPVAREIAYGINDHQFRDFGLFERVRLGPTWQEFRHTFIPSSSDTADLHLDLGGSTGTLEIADVALRRLSDGTGVEADRYQGCACWPPAREDD